MAVTQQETTTFAPTPLGRALAGLVFRLKERDTAYNASFHAFVQAAPRIAAAGVEWGTPEYYVAFDAFNERIEELGTEHGLW